MVNRKCEVRKFYLFIKALFRRKPASILSKFIDAAYSIEKLEQSGTLLIEPEKPGVVMTMDYLTLWNKGYEYYGDDRVLHAWCEKFRAVINLRRGHAFGSEGKKLPVLHSNEPIYITVADPEDPTKPWCVCAETNASVTFQKI